MTVDRSIADPGLLAPTAIAVAPNGGRLGKEDHPALPIGPQELARTAAACLEAGAAMIHAHVRDRDGGHLLDAHAYREVTKAIRDAVGERLIIQITSEAVGRYQPAEQMAVVRATRPEAVSLALRELVPDPSHEAAFAEFLWWLKSERIAPQIILYAPEEASALAAMQQRGLVPFENIPVLYVLGRYTPGQVSRPADLLPFLAHDRPRFARWMVCAFGREETACVTAGALLGGHARVGFENNFSLPDGTTAMDNAALVAATRCALAACGVRTARANDLRAAWSVQR
ncbi:3-keto-5-aminohexanoate cleavage protein [Mesorhizobium sp.]|uniref:3-keto-5-aminohexanoate cleavage protein n=1 Tax=Mesorhizobium sp. TaxID=1871066 RepID=UPI0012286DE5|nr:3-keto-5-aminohexanoate cleavage protein [Mesorhizobium sp.]TIP14284.1 MAG: 3-keto-5-aminohexanoate cleavage protein [Mesorhizobium sp.]